MMCNSKTAAFGAVSLLALAIAAPSQAFAQTTFQTGEIIVTAQKREQKLTDVPITITAYSGRTLDERGIQDLHDLSAYTPGFYLQNQSPNDPGIVMRGVTTDSTDPTNEPRVSIYQDGVSISQVPAAAVELFDLERIEVAKGPQTTLFGRSALTGAVNIIQNKAKEGQSDWLLHVEGGNFNYGLAEGMANVPLSDVLAIRFAGRIKTRDGYINNVLGGDALNGSKAEAARIALNYRPNDRINDDLILNYELDNQSGTAFKNKTFYPSDPTTGQVLGDLSPFSSAALNGSPLLQNGALPHIRRTVKGITNILSFRLNDTLKLTSTTAARSFQADELFDPDGFSFPILTGDSSGHGSELSQDFRLNYDPGGKFSAFAGVSAFGDSGIQRNALVFDERLALALLTGVLNRKNPVAGPIAAYTNVNLMAAELQGVAASGGLNLPAAQALGIANNLSAAHYEQFTTQSHTEAYDVYVDGTYRFTPKLEVSAGIRYTTEDKTSKFSGYVPARSVAGGVIGVAQIGAAQKLNPATTGNCAIPAVVAANPLCQVLAGLALPGATNPAFPLPLFGLQVQPTAGNGNKDAAALSDDGLSWRLTGRYKLTDTLNAYATYARGRRPEVLAAAAPTSPFGASRFTIAPSETLDSYEAGLKGRFLNGRLSLDGAVYYYNYKHFQTTILQGTQFVTTDAGDATTYGFEGQANYAVTPQVDVYATYAYTHGRYGAGILKGNQFRLTPENAVTVGGAWRIPAFGGTIQVLPSYAWRSKVYFNDDNGNPTIQAEEGALVPALQFDQFQKAYGIIDLRVSYAPTGANWKVEAFGSNLGDTHFLKDGGNTGSDLGLPTYIPGEPRFYGVSFTIRR